MATRYAIVLDTNPLYIQDRDNLGHLFHKWLWDLKKFVEENRISNVEICLPQIVIEERIAQRITDTLETSESTNLKVKSLSSIDPSMKEFVWESKKIKEFFQAKASKILSELKIKTLPLPKLDSSNIITRAIDKIPPFSREDCGFKDSLIWLSLLEDAKKNTNSNYIFLTKNTRDFPEEILLKEFRTISKNNFKICENLEDLKEYLDSEFKLNLKLDEKIKHLGKILENHWGEISSKILKKNIGLSENMFYGSSLQNTKKVIGLTLRKIEFENVIPSIGGIFNLEIRLIVKPETQGLVLNNINFNLASSESSLTQPLLSNITPVSYEGCDLNLKDDFPQYLDFLKKEKSENTVLFSFQPDCEIKLKLIYNEQTDKVISINEISVKEPLRKRENSILSFMPGNSWEKI
ncbi:Uncharacterised protein [uncultured archaeon]|nr:Uncharacterised protein [uncultured archaeon]